MQGFGERLRRRAARLGMSDAQVAKAAGLSPRRYGHYVTNDREPDLSTLLRISQVLGTTPDVLLGLVPEDGEGREQALIPGDGVVTYSGDDYAAIAVYDLQLAAGAGREVATERVDHRQLFRMQYLRSLSQAPLDQLAVVEIDGDSMEPTLRTGDAALLDMSQRNPGRRDGLYALRSDGWLQVKRVSSHPTTRLLSIRSDNPAYPSYDDIKPDDVEVLGRVVWIGRRV